METFMYKKTFLIKKVESIDGGWKLYPVDSDSEPIFISQQLYLKKKLPTKYWPWQENSLVITFIDNFMVAAELNDKKLFEISEENYPQEAKDYLSKMRQLLQRMKEDYAKEDEQIKQALTTYLAQIPLVENMEEKASSLHMCLRAYFKLHLLKNKTDDMLKERLSLTFWLLKICEKMYKRHADPDSLLGVCIAGLKWPLMLHLDFDYHCPDEVTNQMKSHGDAWTEIDDLIKSELPNIENPKLYSYIHFIVRTLLVCFSTDYATLDRNYTHDGWHRRLNTDEQDYKINFEKMELLKLTTFILPNQFTDDEIKKFFQSYNLY